MKVEFLVRERPILEAVKQLVLWFHNPVPRIIGESKFTLLIDYSNLYRGLKGPQGVQKRETLTEPRIGQTESEFLE